MAEFSNTAAEQALLGAILIDNGAYGRVAGFLLPVHFFEQFHGDLFRAMGDLMATSRSADPVTLYAFAQSDERLKEAGGGKYLARLAASAVTTSGAKGYAEIIIEAWQRREAKAIAEELLESLDGKPEDSIGQHISDMGEILAGSTAPDVGRLGSYVAKVIDASERAYKNEDVIAGLATGLTDLDNILGGLAPGAFVVLAGRTSMGKTDLAVNIALNMARAGETNLFFSLEMNGEQIAQRALAGISGISTDRQRRGDFQGDDWNRYMASAHDFDTLPLMIECTPKATVEVLKARAQRLKKHYSLGAVIVDYLQLVRPARELDSRVNEVTGITQDLKAMAEELEVPVIALAQLSRKVEERGDKRPQLSDLRESGSIEQDADAVVFLYRESYYLERAEPEVGTVDHDAWQGRMDRCRNQLDLLVPKNRMGRTGKTRVFYNPAHSLIRNLILQETFNMPLGGEI